MMIFKKEAKKSRDIFICKIRQRRKMGNQCASDNGDAGGHLGS